MKRWIIGTVFFLVVLIAVAVVVLAFSLGKILKRTVETVGPQMTQSTVTVDQADLWLIPGRAQLKGVFIGNSTGWKSPKAIQISEVSVRMDPLTLRQAKTVIDEIIIKSPEITLEGGFKKNNLTDLADNVSKYSRRDEESAPAPANPVPKTANQMVAPTKPARVWQVKKVLITGIQLHAVNLLGTSAHFDLPLPNILLTGLGEGPAGITSAELTHALLKALEDSIETNGKDQINSLSQSALSQAKGTLKKLDFQKAAERLKNILHRNQ